MSFGQRAPLFPETAPLADIFQAEVSGKYNAKRHEDVYRCIDTLLMVERERWLGIKTDSRTARTWKPRNHRHNRDGTCGMIWNSLILSNGQYYKIIWSCMKNINSARSCINFMKPGGSSSGPSFLSSSLSLSHWEEN